MLVFNIHDKNGSCSTICEQIFNIQVAYESLDQELYLDSFKSTPCHSLYITLQPLKSDNFHRKQRIIMRISHFCENLTFFVRFSSKCEIFMKISHFENLTFWKSHILEISHFGNLTCWKSHNLIIPHYRNSTLTPNSISFTHEVY